MRVLVYLKFEYFLIIKYSYKIQLKTKSILISSLRGRP